MKKKRILFIEPYFGGSHKHFLTGLQKHLDADGTLLSLPARKWKMRMQLSAPWFLEQIMNMDMDSRIFDTVLCSTFVDVAVLRSLISSQKGGNRLLRYCTYFHENQFVYPEQLEGRSNNFQFTAINFNTALVSDGLAFNSKYNLSSFLDNCEKYIKKASDMKLSIMFDSIVDKCRVLHPGIDFSDIDHAPQKVSGGIPTVIWNHRWEHDKNPEAFFMALFKLQKKGVPFKLIVLGQSFQNMPSIFEHAREKLKKEILHFGYSISRKEYAALLRQGDIIVSTALHEFFGISVLEAVRAGCRPLLPQRLSYPELFDDIYLYSDGELCERLEQLLIDGGRLEDRKAKNITDEFQWTQLRSKYHEWLFD